MEFNLVNLEHAAEEISLVEARAESLARNQSGFLKKLVGFRKHHRLSQEAVAERMGVTQPTVSDFERYDANPTFSTIRRYALAVGVRLEFNVVDDCVDDRWVMQSPLFAGELAQPVPTRSSYVPAGQYNWSFPVPVDA